MLSTIELIDAAKTNAGIESDYRLAQVLGVTKAAVSGYRNGRTHPDDLISRQLAELAGMDPDFVMICMQAERTRDDFCRGLWEAIAKKLQRAGAMAAAVLAVILSTWTGGPDAGAMSSTPQTRANAGSATHQVCVLC